VPSRPRGQAALSVRRLPSSVASRAPWVAGAASPRKGGDPSAMNARARSPRERPPRRGVRSGNQDAFYLQETRRVDGDLRARHVARPQSVFRHAAPSEEGDIAIEKRAPL